MTVSKSQPSGERISCFLSTCKVYNGVDSQLLLTVVELSSVDTMVVSSFKSMLSTTGLALPHFHTFRFAGSPGCSSPLLRKVTSLGTVLNCPFAYPVVVTTQQASITKYLHNTARKVALPNLLSCKFTQSPTLNTCFLFL